MLLDLGESINVSEIGGKAASLGRLIRGGCKVPSGFVVPVDVFRSYVDRARTVPGPGNREGILAELAKIEIDQSLRTDISRRVSALQSRVAIRSSAVREDGEDSSFAGQFFTKLDVEATDDIIEAVRQCWMSVFSANVESYSSGVLSEMAVIVQAMSPVGWSGVLFSCDPNHPDDTVCYTEWVKDVGATLVEEGQLDGRAWFKRNGEVLRADDYREKGLPIPATLLESLAETIKQVESIFDTKCDVEWSWSDGKLTILQSRPITTQSQDFGSKVPPWFLPGRPVGGWSGDQRRWFDYWDEYNPSAVTPLAYDLYMRSLWKANLAALGTSDEIPNLREAVREYRRVAIAIDPAAPLALCEETYEAPSSLSQLEAAIESWVAAADRDREMADNIKGLNNQELLKSLEEVARSYRKANITRLLSMDVWVDGIETTREELSHILKKLFPKNYKVVLEKLGGGIEHETFRLNRAREELITLYAREGLSEHCKNQIRDFVATFGYADSLDSLLPGDLGNNTIDAVSVAAGEEGRVSFLKSWNRSAKTAARLRRRVQRMLEERPSELQHFLNLLQKYRQWLKVREDAKRLQDISMPCLQVIVGEAARRMLEVGAIGDLWEIECYRLDELCLDPKGEFLPKAEVAKRAAVLEWKKTTSWLPKGYTTKLLDLDSVSVDAEGASPGVAVGPVRLVSGVQDFPKVRVGDILVARSTDPRWTEVFDRVAAVVVENGSRLSHAAIVAREFNIPAIVGARGVFDVLREGEKVSIDGEAGSLLRLEME